MKRIRELQYAAARTLYQFLRSKFGENASLNDISALEREIFTATYRGPMSGNIRFNDYEPIDVRSLSTELGIIAADAYTLLSFLDEIGAYLGTIQFTTGVWYSYIRDFVHEPLMRLTSLISDTFIDGVTDEIAIGIMANTDVTTALITDQGYIMLRTLESEPTSKQLTAQDISVRKRGDGVLTVRGDIFEVFNSVTSGVFFSVEGGSTAGYTISANVGVTRANLISIRFHTTTPVRLVVEVSANGRQFTTVFDEVVTRNLVEIPLEPQPVSDTRISFDFATPSRTSFGIPYYELSLSSIRFSHAVRVTDSVYETIPITIPRDGTKAVSLVSRAAVYGNAKIRYFLGLMSGNNVSFIETTPGRPVHLGRLSASFEVKGSGSMSDYVAAPETGGRFYNILAPVSTYSHLGTTLVENGAFNTAQVNIVPRSIRLLRGVSNYARATGMSVTTTVGPLRVMPSLNENGTQVLPVPFPIEFTELIDKDSISGTKIPLTCPMITASAVVRENGERSVALEVVGAGEDQVIGHYIELSADDIAAILSSPSAYTVTYTTSLSAYLSSKRGTATIDRDNLTVTANRELTHGADYYIDDASFELILVEHGNYYQQCKMNLDGTIVELPQLTISYSFVEQLATDESYVWATWIYVPTITTITILPFTTAEVAVGNFHRIDGVNVSTLKQFVVNGGWHFIETTQPFPTSVSNSADVNPLTHQPSLAGIVIPDSATQVAYRESMRQVSLFTLSTLAPADRYKCFSYNDGKVYVAYKPEMVPSSLLNNPGSVPPTGATLLCRKPEYDSTYHCISYTPVPEAFKLSVEYEAVDSPGIDAVIVHVELSAPSLHDTAIVERLGINRLSEV